MDITNLSVGDRIEIYTPSSGTYWGFITAIGADHVTLEDISPDPRGKDLTCRGTRESVQPRTGERVQLSGVSSAVVDASEVRLRPV